MPIHMYMHMHMLRVVDQSVRSRLHVLDYWQQLVQILQVHAQLDQDTHSNIITMDAWQFDHCNRRHLPKSTMLVRHHNPNPNHHHYHPYKIEPK